MNTPAEQTAVFVSVLAILVMFTVIIMAVIVVNKYEKEAAKREAEVLFYYEATHERFDKLAKAHSRLIVRYAALSRAYQASQHEASLVVTDNSTRPLDADPPA